MRRSQKPAAPQDADEPSEAQAATLMEAIFGIDHDALAGLPKAFRDACGKTPPPASDAKVRYNHNAQLRRQQGIDSAERNRTMNQMGGQYGFRGNDKDKGKKH